MPHIAIGSSPAEEDCAQLGTPDYYERARSECRRLIQLIRDRIGPEPEGARLRIASCPHDYGTYLEVVCDYDKSLPESLQYALRCESELPATWE